VSAADGMRTDQLRREVERTASKKRAAFSVAIDFDGTLMEPTGRRFSNFDLGRPMAGAQQFVSRLVQSGATCFVHSVRANDTEGKVAIGAWLRRYSFPIMEIVGKPHAEVYVDDRGLHFDNWSHVYSEIVRQRGRDS
jgi:hypothetical protein